jgi:hypothetical protein
MQGKQKNIKSKTSLLFTSLDAKKKDILCSNKHTNTVIFVSYERRARSLTWWYASSSSLVSET